MQIKLSKIIRGEIYKLFWDHGRPQRPRLLHGAIAPPGHSSIVIFPQFSACGYLICHEIVDLRNGLSGLSAQENQILIYAKTDPHGQYQHKNETGRCTDQVSDKTARSQRGVETHTKYDRFLKQRYVP